MTPPGLFPWAPFWVQNLTLCLTKILKRAPEGSEGRFLRVLKKGLKTEGSWNPFSKDFGSVLSRCWVSRGQQNTGLRVGHFFRRQVGRASWGHKKVDFCMFLRAKLGSENVQVASKNLLGAEKQFFFRGPKTNQKHLNFLVRSAAPGLWGRRHGPHPLGVRF